MGTEQDLIFCLVDNSVKRSSPYWGEHGASYWIQKDGKTLLFDTGQSGDVLLHNMKHANHSPGSIDALAFSHAHYDHTGGLAQLIPYLREGIPVYAHPTLFDERYSVRDGISKSIGISLTRDEMEKHFTLVLEENPLEIFPGLWTTGSITERLFFEGRSARHEVLKNDQRIPDRYTDDLSLVLEDRGELVVICGCCHAGLLNTLAHIEKLFQKSIKAIVGGTHLSSIKEDDLKLTIDQLHNRYGGPTLYLNHCTGEAAINGLASAFPGKVHPFPVGSSLNLD